jgi:hypothetical protein
MQRSAGVTLSAILVFVGCAAALAFGGLMVLAFLLKPSAVLPNSILRGVLVFEIVFDLGFVGWGVASGIGLLRLRGWSRISMLVFSGLMILFCALPMLFVPFVPIPSAEGAPANLTFVIRVVMEVFYGFFVVLGGFWIWFFTRKSVRQQFGAASAATPTLQAPGQPARPPIAITVLAWILIVGGCSTPLVWLMRAPAMAFGYVISPRWAILYYLGFALVSIVAALGMLRLRRWSWNLAVCMQIVGLLNGASMFLVPGAFARFETAMNRQVASLVPAGQPAVALPQMSMISVGFSFGLVFVLAILVVLFVHRGAFNENSSSSTAGASL